MLRRIFFYIVLGLAARAGSTAAQLAPIDQNGMLSTFLRGVFRTGDWEIDRTTRFCSATEDLNGDGIAEVIVHVTGRGVCGTGGCPTLILRRKRNTLSIVSNIAITRGPIRVLTTSSHGWHDISVVVAGGGIRPGYSARLSFDGNSYPRNPSVPPAVRLLTMPEARIVLPSTCQESLLFRYPEPGSALEK